MPSVSPVPMAAASPDYRDNAAAGVAATYSLIHAAMPPGIETCLCRVRAENTGITSVTYRRRVDPTCFTCTAFDAATSAVHEECSPSQAPNTIFSLRYISRINLRTSAISGDRSPLRQLMMIGETACSWSSGRYITSSRRRRSTDDWNQTDAGVRRDQAKRRLQFTHLVTRRAASDRGHDKVQAPDPHSSDAVPSDRRSAARWRGQPAGALLAARGSMVRW